MSVSRRLAAHRASALALSAGMTPDPENPDTETQPEDDADAKDKGKKKTRKDDYMTEDEHKAAVAEAETKAKADGFAEANARMSEVMASEHYAGREPLAQKLLGNAKLDAAEIIDTLAAAPKTEPKAEASDEEIAAKAEEAARAEMQNAISASGNSNIEAGAEGSKADDAKAGAAAWDNVLARMNPKSKAA